MDLRVDMHIFTEICEAVHRGEPLSLYGHDGKGRYCLVELPVEVIKQVRLHAVPKPPCIQARST